jgi:Restriction endonuclease
VTPAEKPWKQFEDLVRRILEARNFSVLHRSARGDRGFDFDGHFAGERWAIEVKYYRTARAQPSLIESAAFRVSNNGFIEHATKAMLVISCLLPDVLRNRLEQRFQITIADRVDLRNWVAASPSPGLVDELDALIEADPASPEDSATVDSDPMARSRPLTKVEAWPADTRGTELCKQLKEVRHGKVGWKDHERVCESILRYLFPNDLQGWHKQKRTDDGLNRFDFICRIHPTREFWKFLINHLNSRYVLFEFKNYSGKIKQGQILTTEKYLLERGLRRVAIILSRSGADQHAIAMTQGAMREHGKLLLILNDENLCDMLHMKERGADPTDCLFDLADNFLLALPR